MTPANGVAHEVLEILFPFDRCTDPLPRSRPSSSRPFSSCGVCEFVGHAGKVTYGNMFTGDNKDKIPGDLGFNPLNMKFDEKLRLNEIKVCVLGIGLCRCQTQCLLSSTGSPTLLTVCLSTALLVCSLVFSERPPRHAWPQRPASPDHDLQDHAHCGPLRSSDLAWNLGSCEMQHLRTSTCVAVSSRRNTAVSAGAPHRRPVINSCTHSLSSFSHLLQRAPFCRALFSGRPEFHNLAWLQCEATLHAIS